MFYAAFTIALLSLVSQSHSDPLTCDDLQRNLEQHELPHLEGRWVMIAGSMLANQSHMEEFRLRESGTIHFFNNASDANIAFTSSFRLDNKCSYDSANITRGRVSCCLTYVGTNKGYFRVEFLYTPCQDCLVMRIYLESMDDWKMMHLYLFSRKREMDPKELETFNHQLRCHGMPFPARMDPTKELCPDQTASNPAAQTEEETVGQKD